MRSLLLTAALLVALPAGAVDIEWVPVGDPGNPPDTATNCLNDAADRGSVPYTYYISKYEVTNAQYAEFLNVVAATDTYGLYGGFKMTRSGSSGSYSYAVEAGFENQPVVYVSFWDAVRFVNWLHNGQGSGDTETGAYTLTADGIANNTIMRNPSAVVFLPSENEWYKAAFHDRALPGYYDYPAGTDAVPTCAPPGGAPNTANCDRAAGSLTDVGCYSGSASPYGTFDQGGNVWELIERILPIVPFSGAPARGFNSHLRVMMGGSYASDAVNLGGATAIAADAGGFDIGFRVATLVPEPAHALLVLTGGLVLAAVRRCRA